MCTFMKSFFTRTDKENIVHGAMIIALFSVISKVLGLFRYTLLAAYFGTGPIAESYYAAFRIPDFIYNALVLGALSTAFIPVFLEVYHNKKREKGAIVLQDLAVEASEEGLSSVNFDLQKQISQAAVIPTPRIKKWWRWGKGKEFFQEKFESSHWHLTNALITSILIVLVFVVGIVWLFTPFLVERMVPGFDENRLSVTIHLTRIMLLSPIIFGVSNIMSAVLQAFKRFTLFALAPVFYNIGIIIGIVLLYPAMGPVGLAWGVVLGALLHLGIQLPAVVKLGYRISFILWWQVKEVKKVLRLILPRAFALSANQINHLVSTFLASSLTAGSLVVFYNAYDIEILPVSLVAVSFAVSSFPTLGELFINKNNEEFRVVLCSVLQKVLILMIPLTLFMILLRAHIVRLILGYGVYDWDATVRTLNVLGILAISLVPQGIVPVLARACYAREDTRSPVIITVVSMIINIVCALILVPRYELLGLALSFTIAAIIHAGFLAAVVEHTVQGVITLHTLKIVAVYSSAAIIASSALYISLQIVGDILGTEKVWKLFVQSGISFLVGCCAYGFILLFLRDPLVLSVREHLKKRLGLVLKKVF